MRACTVYMFNVYSSLLVSDPDLGVLHLLLRPPQRREREGGEIPGQHLPLQRQVTSSS